MLGDPPRCATHKTVLTSGGTCLLCVRRIGEPAGAATPATATATAKILPWATGAIVGGLIVLAVVFKIYLSVSEQHPARAATAEPATMGPPPLPSTVTTGGTGGAMPGNDPASLLAEARRDVVIDLYGASWCPHCVRARAFLDREGIPYAYHDVDAPSNKQDLRMLNARGSVPTFKVDDQVVVGFSEGSVRRTIDRAAHARVARR